MPLLNFSSHIFISSAPTDHVHCSRDVFPIPSLCFFCLFFFLSYPTDDSDGDTIIHTCTFTTIHSHVLQQWQQWWLAYQQLLPIGITTLLHTRPTDSPLCTWPRQWQQRCNDNDTVHHYTHLPHGCYHYIQWWWWRCHHLIIVATTLFTYPNTTTTIWPPQWCIPDQDDDHLLSSTTQSHTHYDNDGPTDSPSHTPCKSKFLNIQIK